MFKKLLILVLFVLPLNLVFSQGKIAYSSNNTPDGKFQIFTMNEDGTDKQQVTNMPAHCLCPKWSSDGNKIAFYTDDENVSPGVYVLDFTADTLNMISYIAEGNHPAFFEDNSTLVFNSEMDGFLSIYVKSPDDIEIYPLTPMGYANQQVLSKDNRVLAFSSYVDDNKNVFAMDLEDTTDNSVYQISQNKEANLSPDVSSDNSMFVYSSFNINLNGTIYLWKDGSEKNITRDIKSCDIPKFSPDDKKIGFLVIDNDYVKLYTMNLDGSNKSHINVKGGNIGTYRWIDNDRILYDAENGVKYVVGIVNVNTGDCTILANTEDNYKPDYIYINKEVNESN